MTAFDRIECRMPEVFDDLAAARVPDYFDDMLRQTARTRQRPAWSAFERWLPMGVIARPLPIRPMPWRLLAVAALVVLLAVSAVVYVGTRPRAVPPPFGVARNGTMLLATEDGDIVRYDPESGRTTPVITGPSRDVGPVFSNDGRRFAFERETDAGVSSYTANADGSDVRQLPHPGTDIRDFEWLPDGNEALVTSAVAGSGIVSIVNVVSGVATQIPLGRDLDVQGATWRPDHDQLVLAVGTDEMFHTFWLVRADGSGLRQLPVSSRAINNPTISPDGRSLVYATWEATAPQGRVRMVDLDQGGDHEITKPDDFVWQAPDFSPDGTRVLLHRFLLNSDPILAQVAVLDVRDGSSVVMGPESTNPQPAMGWSPDGTTVIAEYVTPAQTWLFDADGTNARVAPFSAIERNGATWERLAP